ncbi:MAG: methyltransferase, partial [Candidatus Eremiobacteraeota bacterium]|nr:methyltransferase [Candidatus Eremiobacteraeota bacterium]
MSRANVPSAIWTWSSKSSLHYETFFQRLQPDARVLDVGCGDGRLTVQIAQHVPSGFVLGVDNCYRTLVNTKVSQIGAE